MLRHGSSCPRRHPHHVTQRGNGRARTFFDGGDYALYRDLLAANCRAAGVEVWAWCLMPNHVHLILVPPDADGLRRALARVHRSYAGTIQARHKRTGHFWQGRFGAVAMDEDHLAAALRYVSLNPVRARLVARAQDWRWASTRAHLRGKDDGVTALAPVRDRFPRFADLLDDIPDDDLFDRLPVVILRRSPIVADAAIFALFPLISSRQQWLNRMDAAPFGSRVSTVHGVVSHFFAGRLLRPLREEGRERRPRTAGA